MCSRVYGLWRNRKVSMEMKRGMHAGIVVPIALYGSEVWVLKNKVENRMHVAEMLYLNSIYVLSYKKR